MQVCFFGRDTVCVMSLVMTLGRIRRGRSPDRRWMLSTSADVFGRNNNVHVLKDLYLVVPVVDIQERVIVHTEFYLPNCNVILL